MPHDVFISYSSKDKEIVDLICSSIELSGLKCWIAPRNVRGGSDYAEEIIEAIRTCSLMLLIFSNYSNESAHVKREIDTAINASKTIIPFKITNTEMSLAFVYYLAGIHWIDGTPTPKSHINKLVEQVLLSIPKNSERITENNLIQQLNNLLDQLSKKTREDISSLPYSQIRNLQSKFNAIFSKQIIDDNSNISEDDANEGRYDILQNGAGEILIIIKARKGEPENPRIVYDGGSYALLYKNRNSSIMLTNINEKARPILKGVDEVLVVEMKDNDVVREYKVLLRNVKSLDHLLKLNS